MRGGESGVDTARRTIIGSGIKAVPGLVEKFKSVTELDKVFPHVLEFLSTRELREQHRR